VQLLAILGEASAARLRSVVPGIVQVRATSVEEVERRVNDGERIAVAFDSSAMHDAELLRLVDVCRRGGVAAIHYGDLSRRSADWIARALSQINLEIVLARSDGERMLLNTILASPWARSMPSRVLAGLSAELRSLPSPLTRVVVGLFAGTTVPTKIESVAAASNIAPTTLRFALRRARIRGPATLLRCARIARTYALLTNQDINLDVVARMNGYAAVRTLNNDVRSTTGMGCRAAVALLSADVFAGRLVEFVRDVAVE
jgi:hypothetical protein